MKLLKKETIATHRVLIYGGPKTGKTELASKLAEKFNLIWFDLENGYTTLLKLPEEWKERIELISIPDSRVFPIAIETMMKVVKGTPVNICHAHGKVDCAICKKEALGKDMEEFFTTVELNATKPDTIVVIDSLTQFTNSGIAHITKAQPDDYKLQLDDWGALRVLMDKFLSQIQVARYNVVCITHEEEVAMEDGKKKIVPVCGSSNSSRNTAKYFDHVIYAEVKNKKHNFGSSTGFGMNMVTGSRTDVALENSEKANKAPSLLDIFAPSKDNVNGVVQNGVPVPNGMAKTPGQIAMENLRKQAGK